MDMDPRNLDGNAPQWAVACEEIIQADDDMQQALFALQQSIEELTQTGFQLGNQQPRTRLSNQQATTNNFDSANLDLDAPLCCFRKVNHGIGCSLPGAPSKHRPIPVLNVGDLVSREFFLPVFETCSGGATAKSTSSAYS